MWRAARKQEKHIKTMLVDYKRRAERRRIFYERIKQDPVKFLRVYGRPAKIHLESEVAKAAENPRNTMAWIGDPTVTIDRFDVRANLEHYDGNQPTEPTKLTSIERIENRLCNYERYRCLIHNEYVSVTEETALKQIETDEMYGDLEKRRKEEEELNRKLTQEPKAAIGFTYADGIIVPGSGSSSTDTSANIAIGSVNVDSDSDGDADSDMDIDVELDLSTVGPDGYRQLAKSAASFGLHPSDFVRLLDTDQQLETELRSAKALEEEKLQLSGRKSRRARRVLKERRAQEKFVNPRTVRIGLLNGQPISRRTVYLSASSTDSADYQSDDDDDVGLQAFLAPADVRARQAKAKPLLINSRGPSVLIGGMTSIGLCRRKHRSSFGFHQPTGLGGERTGSDSSSTSSASSGDNVPGHHRRRRRSGSRDSRSSPNSWRTIPHFRSKRSRVEYITTFGENDDGRRSSSSSKATVGHPSSTIAGHRGGGGVVGKPGAAASAVAASVVSKILGSSSAACEPAHSTAAAATASASVVTIDNQTPYSSRGKHLRSPPVSDSRRFHSSFGRRHQSRSCSSRDSRHSISPTAKGSNFGFHRGRASPPDHPPPINNNNNNKQAAQHWNAERPSIPSDSIEVKRPSPPVRQRYYRPELESGSDGEGLSDESETQSKPKSSASIVGSSSSFKPQDSRMTVGSIAGKMITSTGEPSKSVGDDLKSTPVRVGGGGGGMRMTPQELLKRRVQLQLTKAFNADKKAEFARQLQLEQERQAREEDLRRQAFMLKRQEEKKLQSERRVVSESSSRSSSSSSSSRSPSHVRGAPSHRPSRFSSSKHSPPSRNRGISPSFISKRFGSPSLDQNEGSDRRNSGRFTRGSRSSMTSSRLSSPRLASISGRPPYPSATSRPYAGSHTSNSNRSPSPDRRSRRDDRFAETRRMPVTDQPWSHTKSTKMSCTASHSVNSRPTNAGSSFSYADRRDNSNVQRRYRPYY